MNSEPNSESKTDATSKLTAESFIHSVRKRKEWNNMKYVSQKHFFYRLKTYSVKKIVTPKPALASCPANVCEFYNSISLSFTYTGVNILMHNK